MKEEDKRKRKVTAFKPSTTVSERSKTYLTTYIDDGGNIIKTVHDGNFNPYPTPPTPTADYMYFEAAEANSTVSMISMLATAPDLEYSTDGVTFQEWQHTTADGVHTFDTITLTDVGDRVYLRGDNPNGLSSFISGEPPRLLPSFFLMSGKIAGGGNIMSLLDKTMEMTVVPAIGFLALFVDMLNNNPNTALITTPSMSTITEILELGCEGMYASCTALTSAANMPSLSTLSGESIEGMYQECTFAMSDDGTTLNFDFLIPPFTVGEETFTTAYEIAQYMGNTNGFTTP